MQDGCGRFGEGGGDDKQTRVFPAFFMSFERNDRKVEGTFLGSALRSALPNSIAIFLGCLAAFFAAPYFGLTHAQKDLVMYLTVGIVSLAGVIKASQPMNLLHGVLSAVSVLGFFGAVLLFGPMLQLPRIAGNGAMLLLLITIPSILIAVLLKVPCRKRNRCLAADDRVTKAATRGA